MDWGKSAYVKAEELEKYIRGRGEGDTRYAVTACFAPRTSLVTPYAPCSISGKGNVALTVSVSLRFVKAAENAVLYLYCGVPATSIRVTGAAGTRADYTMLAAVYPGDGAPLQLRCDDDAILLERLQIMVQGENAAVTGGGERTRADAYGENVYWAYTRDGYIYVRRYGGAAALVEHGAVFDLAATASGAEVICADSHGNLYGCVYDTSLRLQSRRRLGPAPEAVAIGQFGDERLIAGLFEGELYFATSEAGFVGFGDWVKSTPSVRASDVALSRGGMYAALILYRDGEYTVRLPARQCHTGANMSMVPLFAEK